MNNCYFLISMDKLVTIMETSCPPAAGTEKVNMCNNYDCDCKECWKSWLTEREDNHE